MRLAFLQAALFQCPIHPANHSTSDISHATGVSGISGATEVSGISGATGVSGVAGATGEAVGCASTTASAFGSPLAPYLTAAGRAGAAAAAAAAAAGGGGGGGGGGDGAGEAAAGQAKSRGHVCLRVDGRCFWASKMLLCARSKHVITIIVPFFAKLFSLLFSLVFLFLE